MCASLPAVPSFTAVCIPLPGRCPALLERHVPLDGKDVPYLYGADCGPDLVRALAEVASTADSLVLVVDSNVAVHAEPISRGLADTVALATFAVDAAERHKTLTLVENIVEHAITLGATKNSVV